MTPNDRHRVKATPVAYGSQRVKAPPVPGFSNTILVTMLATGVVAHLQWFSAPLK